MSKKDNRTYYNLQCIFYTELHKALNMKKQTSSTNHLTSEQQLNIMISASVLYM